MFIPLRNRQTGRAWWCTPLIPALGDRGRQISEFEASLVYRVSSRTAKTIQRNPVSKKQQKKGGHKQCPTSHTQTSLNTKENHVPEFASTYGLVGQKEPRETLR